MQKDIGAWQVVPLGQRSTTQLLLQVFIPISFV
jgi:hypothetical protein